MTIYSWDGREVSIGAAMRRAEYSNAAHRTVDVWYVKLRVAGTGRLLNQGQWFSTANLRADNGWKEIQKALRAAGDPSAKTARKKALPKCSAIPS
ncbi:MAG: hypothetical protein ACR2P1_03520 [Pseudomonadales bacterium]